MWATAQQQWSSCVPVVYKGVTWAGGASKSRNETRNETKQRPHPQIYYFGAHASQHTYNFSLWLAPSLNSVSEVRLMFFCVFLAVAAIDTFAYCTRVLAI